MQKETTVKFSQDEIEKIKKSGDLVKRSLTNLGKAAAIFVTASAEFNKNMNNFNKVIADEEDLNVLSKEEENKDNTKE